MGSLALQGEKLEMTGDRASLFSQERWEVGSGVIGSDLDAASIKVSALMLAVVKVILPFKAKWLKMVLYG